MSEQLTLLRNCIRDATTDPAAETLLRGIIRGAGDQAPINDLCELGEKLVEMRMRIIESN